MADSRSQASGTFEQNNHVVINNDGTNGQIGPQALKAVYDVARKAAMDVVTGQMRDGGLFLRRWTMKTFRWKVKPDMEVNSQPSVREVRFGDGYSQRMAAGLNADLKTYRVTLSVTREEARHLEAFLAEHGGWKAFLWTPPYAWRQIKVTCAAWSSRVRMLRVEFSAEFKQVVN